MITTADEARTLIARVRSDITFLASVPQGKIMTDQMHAGQAHSRLQEVIDNVKNLTNAVDPDRVEEDSEEAKGESDAPEPNTEGGADEVTTGPGAAETAPQEPAPTP